MTTLDDKCHCNLLIANLIGSSSQPLSKIRFGSFSIFQSGEGDLVIRDEESGVDRLTIDSDGSPIFSGSTLTANGVEIDSTVGVSSK